MKKGGEIGCILGTKLLLLLFVFAVDVDWKNLNMNESLQMSSGYLLKVERFLVSGLPQWRPNHLDVEIFCTIMRNKERQSTSFDQKDMIFRINSFFLLLGLNGKHRWGGFGDEKETKEFHWSDPPPQESISFPSPPPRFSSPKQHSWNWKSPWILCVSPRLSRPRSNRFS